MIEIHPSYTIEIVLRSGEQIRRRVIAQFDDGVYGRFWDELGVTDQHWSQWHDAPSSGQPFTLVPGAPQLSRMASVDEGMVKYAGAALQQLRDECVSVLLRTGSAEARTLLNHLINGSAVASEENGELTIHPFGI
jgi:hypothetical protein